MEVMGDSTLGKVQFQGSWQRGSSQELHSKQSIVSPATYTRLLMQYYYSTTTTTTASSSTIVVL